MLTFLTTYQSDSISKSYIITQTSTNISLTLFNIFPLQVHLSRPCEVPRLDHDQISVFVPYRRSPDDPLDVSISPEYIGYLKKSIRMVFVIRIQPSHYFPRSFVESLVDSRVMSIIRLALPIR